MARVISFYPLENRPALLADLAVTLKSIISQRLIKTPDGGRAPAVEVLLNSRHIGELIEKGDMSGIKESMDQSMSPGSQTFEQALFKLYKAGTITLEEATANADSANNFLYLINNDQSGAPTGTPGGQAPAFDPTKSVTPGSGFSEFKLKVD